MHKLRILLCSETKIIPEKIANYVQIMCNCALWDSYLKGKLVLVMTVTLGEASRNTIKVMSCWHGARDDGGENLVIEGFMPRFQNLIDSNRYLYRPRASGLESFARRCTRNKHKNWSIRLLA